MLSDRSEEGPPNGDGEGLNAPFGARCFLTENNVNLYQVIEDAS